MKAIVVGPDRGLEAALEAEGIDPVRVDGHATLDSLAEAGVGGADLLILTDVSEATGIPVAKDENPDLRVVIYAGETMPEFVRGQVDFAVAPDLFSPEVLAEELAAAA